MSRNTPIIAIVILGFCVPAFATEQILRIDAGTTDIDFSLGSTLHTVHGTMNVTEGTVVFDDDSGAASGRIVIDAQSGDTDNAKRDRKMHDKVLESQRYPDIVFTPTGIRGKLNDSGSSDITLAGIIALHGDEHPVEIQTRVNRELDHIRSDFEITIPFVEWGLEDPSVFVFRTDKEVQVKVEVHGTIEVAP